MKGRFDTFTTVIASLYQSVQKIKIMEMEEFGLRSGHVTCLHHLYANPDGLTLKELTALCAIDKAAVSRYLAVLAERGYAKVEEQETRKYNLKWTLTEPGRKAAEDIDGRIDRAVSAGGDACGAGTGGCCRSRRVRGNLNCLCRNANSPQFCCKRSGADFSAPALHERNKGYLS